jgi:hypothetical protein
MESNQTKSSPFFLECTAIAIEKKCFFEVKEILKLKASTIDSPAASTKYKPHSQNKNPFLVLSKFK